MGKRSVGLVLGIDEAGRGPVIGPLVLAGVLIAEERLGELARLGVRDSKRLSRPRRKALAQQIRALAHKVRLISFSPSQLEEESLTEIELAGMAELILKLKPAKVYLDAPVSPWGISRYVGLLRGRLGGVRAEIVAENKADAEYPVVAAASIVAKVERDRAIEALRERYGDFGWGYPSERKTRKFLREWYAAHGEFPPCVRRHWQTARRILENPQRGGQITPRFLRSSK